MYYRPEDGHGLPHNPFSAIVAPRPIGWISTRAGDGTENLAPYSFFNAIAYTPPQVMFSSTATKPDRTEGKDSVSNIRETGVFCCNVASRALAEEMNASSGTYPRDVDEFARTGLERVPCEEIPCSRVAAAPAALECRMLDIITLKGETNLLVLGEVVGIHIDEAHLKNGLLDLPSYAPLGRLGYRDYAAVTEIFEMARPD